MMMQSQIVNLPQKGVLVMYIKTVTFEVLAEVKETF
ncbi:antibiotic biosynthesis monooxygenase, partial [Escherichia coli]